MALRFASVSLIALIIAFGLVATSSGARAQLGSLSDARSDAQDALDDALLATPNAVTPVPLSNLYATAPGLEQQIVKPQLRTNLLLPAAYNSNGEEISRGGTTTAEANPRGSLSWSGPISNLPLRLSLGAFAQSDRYSRTPAMDLDKIGLSARMQFVDPSNDQAFSPFIAFAPRWDYGPVFETQRSARQDLNFGFNKRWNFDAGFRQLAIAGNSSDSTVWSFGLTAFVQRRLREPQVSSDAAFVIPSVSLVINKQWNVTLATEFIRRWFDQNSLGIVTSDYELHPIATFEYIIPATAFGGERNARLFGNPAIDFQGSYLKVWSTASGGSYAQWKGVAALKMGW